MVSEMGACLTTECRSMYAKYASIPDRGRIVLVPTCVGDELEARQKGVDDPEKVSDT